MPFIRTWWRLAAVLWTLGTAVGDKGISRSEAENRTGSEGDTGDDKYALVVGISNYHGKTREDWVNLHGAEDAETMRQALRQRGFADQHICVLTDERATLRGIEEKFRTCLILKARKDVSLVFYFSGHGNQVPDDNGDEEDSLDEALVPYDWDAGPERQNYLRDDRLAALLAEARAPMQNAAGELQGSISVFLDSCFSGSATRGDNKNLIYRGPLHRPLHPAAGPPHGAVAKGPTGFLTPGTGSDQMVVISATQRDESSLEMPLVVGGTPRGVFTQVLTEALKTHPGPRTPRALFEQLRYLVTQYSPGQHPQMEGSPDATSRALFSQQPVQEGHYIPITKVDAARRIVTLPVGLLHGATRGSHYALFPSGQQLGAVHGCDRQAGCLGKIVLETVGTASSTAPLPSEVPAGRLVAGRAVEILHYQAETPPLRVWVMPNTPVPLSLFSTDPSSVVVPGTQQEHDVRVEVRDGALWVVRRDVPLLNARGSAAGGQLTPDSNGVLFRKVLPTPAKADTRALTPTRLYEELDRALRTYWVYGHLMRLHGNRDSLSVGLRLRRGSLPDPVMVAPDQVLFKLEEEVTLELQNESAVPVYVSLIELTPQGDITVLYPNADLQHGITSNLLPAHAAWTQVGTKVHLDPTGQVLWKLLITQQPADFSVLAQQRVLKGPGPVPTASGLPASAQPLGQLLLNGALRRRSQNLTYRPDGWATRDYLVRIGGMP